MPHSEPAEKLVERWRSGDETAADELYRRYAERLCKLAQQQMDRRLARRVGPDDIVQSVFRTFFRRSGEGQFQIDHSNSLWQLLARITINKVRRHGKRHRAAKRDVAREVHGTDEQLSPEDVAHAPGPEEAVALADELELILRDMRPPRPEVLNLCLQGYSASEIASRVKRSRWTVRRMLDEIGERLRDRMEEDPE